MTELNKQQILDELKEHRDMEGSTANGYARDVLKILEGIGGDTKEHLKDGEARIKWVDETYPNNNTKMNKYKALISYLSWWDSPHRKRGKAVSTEKGLEKQADRTELTIAK